MARRRGGRRRARSVSGRVTVRYGDGASFNSLSLSLLLLGGPVIDKFNWHYRFGSRGGFNYNVVPGRFLGRKGVVKVVHSHYLVGGEYVHLRFFPGLSPRRALSYAVRGFLNLHRVASRRLGVERIESSGPLLRGLKEYLEELDVGD